MKKKLLNQPIIGILLVIVIFPGCLKDRITHTYTLTVPVYKSLSAVRADMKTAPATDVASVGKIYIQGNYIFLCEKEKGIHIIDNTNPSSPRNISFINIPGNEDIAIRGSTLYADSYNDLVALDISDPMHVAAKKFLTNVFPERGNYYSGTNPDSIMVIIDWIRKDTTVDYNEQPPMYYYYTTCSSCAYLSSTNAPAASVGDKGTGGSMARFTVINDYLYTVTTQNLNVFDISVPENPTFHANSQLNWIAETIFPFKNRLFIGTSSGIFMYDIASTPDNPARDGEFAHARSCDPVIADNNYAYVTLSDGTKCQGFENQLDIVDIKNLDNNVSFLAKSYPLTHPQGLSKDGNTLFICDDKAGLKIFDASDVMNLKLITNLKDDETFDVITTNGLALVVGKTGLYQYDYTDLNNIHLVSKMSTGKN
jgi:hypothetical protein